MDVPDARGRVELEFSMAHPQQILHSGKVLFVDILVLPEFSSMMVISLCLAAAWVLRP